MNGPFNLFSRISLFRAKKRASAGTARRYTLTNPYHAVSVHAGSGSCPAALGCAGERFLSTEAPTLPLKGCDASSCKCRYQHHEDRRRGSRRLSDIAHYQNHLWRGEERRRGGRRVNDV